LTSDSAETLGPMRNETVEMYLYGPQFSIILDVEMYLYGPQFSIILDVEMYLCGPRLRLSSLQYCNVSVTILDR